MTDSVATGNIGLDSVAETLQSIWSSGSLRIGATENVLGRIGTAGGILPLFSSAARISIDDASIWIPSPLSADRDDSALAPLFLFGDQRYVMPFIRLICEGCEDQPEYITFPQWVSDALTRWRFIRRDDKELVTVSDVLIDYGDRPKEALRIIGAAIWHALFGNDVARAGLGPARGLEIPPRGMWLRPVKSGPLAERVARSIVITAKMPAPRKAGGNPVAEVPSTRLSSRAARIQPTRDADFGLDPVHTPENGNIRLTGRLGVGVRVSPERKLVVGGNGPPRSPSTATLPYTGYNDPRRLLMAANAQVHAVQLDHAELPLILGNAGATEELPMPPGCNLRVAYLGWQGLNHEDAWVISASAAQKLRLTDTWTQTLFVRAVEMRPRLLVSEDDAVHRGQLLLQRRLCPWMLDLHGDGPLGRSDEDGCIAIAPERGDRAWRNGTIVGIDTLDLHATEGLPRMGPRVRADWRSRVCVTLRRILCVAVGDKLANRHGHKGIVGAILPDDQMPQWRGRPLEALIDPISVLNRANWGQVMETLVAAACAEGFVQGAATRMLSREEVLKIVRPLGADERGRSLIEMPHGSHVRAVAGVQFVVRLPHNACDKLSLGQRVGELSPSPRIRPQRFGEMEQWALWAHGVAKPKCTTPRLSHSAARVQRLLATAGFELTIDGKTPDADGKPKLIVRRYPLDGPLPKSMKPIESRMSLKRRKKLTRQELYETIDSIQPDEQTALVLTPPVVVGRGPRRHTIRWIPLLPLCDRPAGRPGKPHALTRHVRLVARAALVRTRAFGTANGHVEDGDKRLADALATLQREALRRAVGIRATGPGSSKDSLLRRAVFGTRLAHSARATAAPALPGTLGLDEVGVPTSVARALLGTRSCGLDDEALAGELRRKKVWLKRDPVLHRWGLLNVTATVTGEDVIRLPASMLSPMGADFDGDTVAMFGRLPGGLTDSGDATPSSLAWDEVMDRPMFTPGKQYLYGLQLLRESPRLITLLQHRLKQAGSPRWPDESPPVEAWKKWLREAYASSSSAKGRWWAIIEQTAAEALAENPGMDFGLLLPQDIARLPAMVCGAAKPHAYDKARRKAFAATSRIMEGRSLDVYARRPVGSHGDGLSIERAPDGDAIEAVMVVAKSSVARFGGVLRRILYSLDTLGPDAAELVAAAQTLTEQITQTVLSVKAGETAMPFSEYDKQVTLLCKGKWKPSAVVPRSKMHEFLLKSGDDAARRRLALWQKLAGAVSSGAEIPWLGWLREPHTIRERGTVPKTGLCLPLTDLRAAAFCRGPSTP